MATLDNLSDRQKAALNNLAYVNIPDLLRSITISTLIKIGLIRGKDKKDFVGLEDYRIINFKNNNSGTFIPGSTNSGFAGIVFEDTGGNRGISLRGTESTEDWRDNIVATLTGRSKQGKEAIEFFENNIVNFESNIYLFGHSKGGELAAQIYAVYHSIVAVMTIINAQPINSYILSKEQRKAFKSDKIDSIIFDGDFVSCLGASPYANRNRIVKISRRYYNNQKLINKLAAPHLLGSAYYDETGNMIDENNRFMRYPVQGLVCVFAKTIISVAQGVGFVLAV